MQSDHKPTLPFFVLVFLFSIPFWVLGLVYPIQLLPGLPLSALGAFAPSLAAFALAYRHNRFVGVWQFLRRSFDFWRIENWRWVFAILLINPAIALLAYLAMGLDGKPLPDPTPLTFAILPMFLFFFIGALGEEIGWTGYATEPLLRRWGTVPTGIILGLVWAVWHFIALAQASRSVEWIFWWSLGTVSLRVLMVWLYTRAGKSVLAAALFHAMVNMCWQLFPNNGSHYDPRIFGLVTLGLVIVLFGGQRWFGDSTVRA